jgi:excisionase family DNA binding protein
MTAETAAIILGVSASTVRRYITGGKLEATKYGREYNIERPAFIHFFRQTWAPSADFEKFLYKRADLIAGPAKLELYDLLSMA